MSLTVPVVVNPVPEAVTMDAQIIATAFVAVIAGHTVNPKLKSDLLTLLYMTSMGFYSHRRYLSNGSENHNIHCYKGLSISM